MLKDCGTELFSLNKIKGKVVKKFKKDSQKGMPNYVMVHSSILGVRWFVQFIQNNNLFVLWHVRRMIPGIWSAGGIRSTS
jgi:hypothetical protein